MYIITLNGDVTMYKVYALTSQQLICRMRPGGYILCKDDSNTGDFIALSAKVLTYPMNQNHKNRTNSHRIN